MRQCLTRLVALAASCALSLAACGQPAGGGGYTVQDADTLLASGAFDPSMAPVANPDIVAAVYGIDPETLEACVCYMATNTSVSADELTVLVLTDAQAAQAAAQACQARVDSQIAVCRNYAPAAVPRLEGAVIRQAGATVLLAVGDPAILPGAVKALDS